MAVLGVREGLGQETSDVLDGLLQGGSGDSEGLGSDTAGSAGKPRTSPPEPASERVIEEVVVTARKRAESLQDVPLSVSAFSGAEIEQAGYFEVSSLADYAPNFEMESIDPGRTFTYIRGIGTRRFDPGVDQSVATFVDGVYRGRSYTTNADLLSAERVEVLKGPQGTLYGKNTIGGAISITTAKPRMDSWGGRFAYEPGFGSVDGDGFHNFTLLASGPVLEDRLGASLAMSRRDRDGYQEILDDDPPEGRVREGVRGGLEDSWNGKLKLDWWVTDALEITFAGGAIVIDGPPVFFVRNDGGDPNATITAQNPLVPTPDAPNSPRKGVSSVDSPFLRTEVANASTIADWDLGAFSLTSITGFENARYRESYDVEGTGLDILDEVVHEDALQLTQELRGDLDWGVLRMMAGLFYAEDRTDRFERVIAGDDSIAAPFNAGMGTNLDFFTDLRTRSAAGFGQLNWDVTSFIELTLGLRFSYDEKKSRLRAENDALLPPEIFGAVAEEYSFPLSQNWTSVDPLASLSWQALEETMLYATYSTGYKSGGFQWLALSEENARKTFDPESVDNFEIGAKSTFLDRALQTNLALFRMEYEDLQVLTFDTSGLLPVAANDNAASSTIQGIELEGKALLGAAVSANFAYAFLHAIYDDYLQDPEDPSTQRKGNRLPRTPEHSFSVALDYDRDLGPGTFRSRLGYAWKASYFWEPDNDTPSRDQEEPSLGLVDASVGYAWGPWSVNVWAQNLTDETYRIMLLDFGPGVESLDVYAPPRTVGFQLSYAFG